MTQTLQAQQTINHYLESNKTQIDVQLEIILRDMVPSSLQTDNYDSALEHSVLRGGKRLRPIMTLATYEMFNPALDSQIMRMSCVTELIHAGSLMLDDLPCMDNAEYRRGDKSSHAMFGESLTILSSAALWIESFRMLSELPAHQSSILVAKTANCTGGKGLIQGQLLDLAAFNSAQTIDELSKCYALKTGVMFDLAVTIGGVLGGATDKELAELQSFATSYGIAYQIRDDIIDSVQSFEQTGKDTNSDIKNNKPNYVSLLGVEKATDELHNTIESALSRLDSLGKTDDIHLRALTTKLREY